MLRLWTPAWVALLALIGLASHSAAQTRLPKQLVAGRPLVFYVLGYQIFGLAEWQRLSLRQLEQELHDVDGQFKRTPTEALAIRRLRMLRACDGVRHQRQFERDDALGKTPRLPDYKPLVAAARRYLALSKIHRWRQDDEALYYIALALTEMGRPAATRAWRMLATRRPRSPLAGEAWLRVAEAHFESTQFALAVAAYRAAEQQLRRRCRPRSTRGACALLITTRYKLGWAHARLAQLGAAIAVWRALLQQLPAKRASADMRRELTPLVQLACRALGQRPASCHPPSAKR